MTNVFNEHYTKGYLEMAMRWHCLYCEFKNQSKAIICSLCHKIKAVTTEEIKDDGSWYCFHCTSKNAKSEDKKCKVCDKTKKVIK